MANKFALLIGNTQYDDSTLSRLTAPSGDVQELASLLRLPAIGGFDDVTTLLNASSDTVRKQIATFFEEKAPDDLLLLYFSGHGVRDNNGRLFFAVRDSEARSLRASAIAASFISEEMDDTHSKRVVLVLDCCHSGAFAQGMKGVTGESAGTATALEGNGFGRVVLTATDATQYALEGERVVGTAFDSVFTHYLIAGIKSGEADTNADGKISVDELYEYVHDQVVTANPKQTPCKFTYKQQGDFIIARNPAPKVTPLALPAEVQRVIESEVAWERFGAIAFLAGWLQSDDRGKAATARAALAKLAADDSRKVSTAATEALSKAPPDPQVEAARQAQVEAEQKARAAAEEQARAEAEQRARAEAEQHARAEAGQQAFEAGQRARAEAEQRAKVDAQRGPQPPVIPTPAAQPRSGKAVAGLVCSILGIFCISVPLLAFVLGGIGIFLGRNAIKQIDASRGAMKGKTIATWAWVLGLVAIAFGFIVWVYLVSTSRYLSPYQ